MKLSKKTTLIISFTLGMLLFATTALADIANKSGYEQLKDTIKATAETASEDLNSFTMDISMAVKANELTMMSNNEVVRIDRSSNAMESISNQDSLTNPSYSHYSYQDKNTTIRKGMDDETYYVTEYPQERENFNDFKNPFKENGAEDLERIADALVGSLKDHVVVKENSDGSKEFSGSLNEIQIPALINALASFQLKQGFNGHGNQIQMPHLDKDIFVKEISGFAVANKDGMLESIRGNAVLSGKDSEGLVHGFTFEVLLTFTNINSTIVEKPDLADKKVIKTIANDSKFGPEITNPQKFIGKFKNDILIEENNQFVKIGERHVVITHIDNQQLAGRYYEEYRNGYEQYAASGKSTFTFDGRFDSSAPHANINYTDESGTQRNGSIFFEQQSAKLHLNFEHNPMKNGLWHDSLFSPALD